MATTRNDLREWFRRGVQQKADRMIVVVDTFDYEDYPVYLTDDIYWDEQAQYNGQNMQRIMEVYDLHADMEEQIGTSRVNNTPPRPEPEDARKSV